MSRQRMCYCTSKGCGSLCAADPVTGKLVYGRLLGDTAWKTHQLMDQTAGVSLGDQSILRASLGGASPIDPVTSSRTHTRNSRSPQRTTSTASRNTEASDNNPSSAQEEASSDHHSLRSIKRDFDAARDKFVYPSSLTFTSDGSLLSMRNTPTQLFLDHQRNIRRFRKMLENLGTEAHPKVFQEEKGHLLREIQDHQTFLDNTVQQFWDLEQATQAYRARASNMSDMREKIIIHENDVHFAKESRVSGYAIAMTGSVIVVLALYLLGGVSTSNCDLLLRTLPIVITAAVQVGNPLASPIPKEWPTDLRTALKHFPLDPDLIENASCPRCCNLTPPDANGQYPSTCTFRETISDPECGAELLQKDRKPIRRYLYQPMGLWLGHMLARPGIEELMDKAWVPPPYRAVGVLKDIWDGNVLQLFSSDGAREVKDPGTGVREGRLVFSLFVDWFNPFGTGRRGKHISVGAIYLICLNLPPHLRFRAENVYLAGIIPGPAEPRLHEINHFLRPLVDDFLHFFAPGFLCSRTPSSSLGRRFRCLLIPFVADVLAARKTSGFTSHGATFFCSFCRLLKEQICRSFNPQDWPRMDANEHRRIANMWKNAGSTTEREAIAKEYGIRYSELLRLPYWDPSRFTILDSMHNLFLGDFKHHIDDIWTTSAPKKKEATKKTIPHTPEQQGSDLQKLKVFITSGGKDGHARDIRRGYFVAFAKANNVEPSRGTTKAHYSEALLQWYNNLAPESRSSITVPTPHTEPTTDLGAALYDNRRPAVLTAAVLKEIRKDIEQTVLPSWLVSVPRNFGDPSHGKLTADQWRTLCSVNLVITLTRLWGVKREGQEKPDDRTEGSMGDLDDATQDPDDDATDTSGGMGLELLRNFIHLVTAVRWATMRITSEGHCKIISFHLHQYLVTLLTMFPVSVVSPNNHFTLHLVECLRDFGPVHSWWSFPFERYNGVLQRIKTNRKLGSVELTFMRSFCRAANLRHYLTRKSNTPSPLQALKNQLLAAFTSATGFGTLENDLLSLDDASVVDDAENTPPTARIPLDPDVHLHLLARLSLDGVPSEDIPHFGFEQKKVMVGGVIYRPSRERLLVTKRENKRNPDMLYRRRRGVIQESVQDDRNNRVTLVSEKDSLILFRDMKEIKAGRIKQIFSQARAGGLESFLVLEVFHRIPDCQHDPYRQFPLLDVYLCENDPKGMTVVKTTDIVSHFASCPYGNETGYRVVLSLNREQLAPAYDFLESVLVV